MDAKRTFVFCLLMLSLIIDESFLMLSGKIVNDTQFYYRTLSVCPSKLATISVTFNNRHMYDQCSECNVTLHIYTTDRDIQKDIESQCHNKEYGQLRNETLNTLLRARSKPYRFTICILNKTDNETVPCSGKTTIQDYKPRNYSFSFGFDCADHSKCPTLKGLSFYFDIYEQQNKTKCSPSSVDMEYQGCWKFYGHMSLPNLIGDPDLKSVIQWFGNLDVYEVFMTSILPPESKGLCYQHTYEILCQIAVPQCYPLGNQVIHPCRKTCYDVIKGCSRYFLNKQSTVHLILQTMFEFTSASVKDIIECDYLPSRNGSIPCFYKPVTCGAPPSATNAFTDLNGNSYAVKTQVQNSCVNESFRIE